jgi:hypothetical protein
VLHLRKDRTLAGRIDGRKVKGVIPSRAVPGPLPAIEQFELTPVEKRIRADHTGAVAGGGVFR